MVAYLALMTPWAQTRLVKYLSWRLEQQTGLEITIGRVDFRPIESLILEDLLVRDFRRDTVLFARKMTSRIDSLSFVRRKFTITELRFDEGDFHLRVERGADASVTNIEELLQTFAPRNEPVTSPVEWRVNITRVVLDSCRFTYRENQLDSVGYGINWSDIDCRDLSVAVSEIDFTGGNYKARVEGLRCREKSGFALEEVSGRMRVGGGHLEVTDTWISTARSRLYLDTLEFDWNPGQRDWRYFTQRMRQRYVFQGSRVHFDDLAYFNATLLGMENVVAGSGVVTGTIEHLAGHDLHLWIGEQSEIRADFTSDGLPRFFDTDFAIRVHEARISPRELAEIYMPWIESHRVVLPEPFHRLGTIDLEGTFTGKIDRFTLLATTANPGLKGEVELLYGPDRELAEHYRYDGRARFDRVDAGLLSGQEFLKEGSISLEFDGVTGEHPSFLMEGRIPRLEVFDGAWQDAYVVLGSHAGQSSLYAVVDNDSVRVDLSVVGLLSEDSTRVWSVQGDVALHGWNSWAPSLFGDGESARFHLSGSLRTREENRFLEARLSDLHYSNQRGEISLEVVDLVHTEAGVFSVSSLSSDFLDINMDGHYRSAQLSQLLCTWQQVYFPSHKSASGKRLQNKMDISCEAVLRDTRSLLPVIYPDLSLPANLNLSGFYDSSDGGLHVRFQADSVAWKTWELADVTLRVEGDTSLLRVRLGADHLRYGDLGIVYNVRNAMHIRPDRLDNDLTWSNWGEQTYSGALSASMRWMKLGDRHLSQLQVYPGVIMMADTVWRVEPSLILLEEEYLFVNNFEIRRGDQFLRVRGRLGESARDTLLMQFDRFRLDDFNHLLPPRMRLDGELNGQVRVQGFYGDRILHAELQLSDWRLNDDPLGTLDIHSLWDPADKRLNIGLHHRLEDRSPLVVSGYYVPDGQQLYAQARLSGIDVAHFAPYLPESISEATGKLSGNVELLSVAGDYALNGSLDMQEIRVKLAGLNTVFGIENRLNIVENYLLLDSLSLFDGAMRPVACQGYYDLRKGEYDAQVRMNNAMVLNAEPGPEESVYGQLYLSGLLRASNPNGYPVIAADLKTENQSRLFVPLAGTGEVDSYNFLHFVNSPQSETRQRLGELRTSLADRMELNASLEITDGLELQLLFDPTVGDILKATGHGDFRIALDKDNQVSLVGEYVVSRGDYLFTMGNLVNKKFVLNPGGSITWSGSPYDARIDIRAIYNLRVSLSDLAELSELSEGYVKVPVECVLILKENLSNPTVAFALEFPSLDIQTRSTLQGLFAGPDDLNKQVFSLLILNRFYTMDNMDNWRDAGYQAGVATASELLSNQLSHWLSQISNRFDIGLSYRPGDSENNNEFEVALSTQILNNRVTISANGNMVEGARANDQAPITGDFDVEVKLNKPGTLRLKAYSHTDERVIFRDVETVQGVGISYQENFDSLRELCRKYFAFLRRNRHKNPKP